MKTVFPRLPRVVFLLLMLFLPALATAAEPAAKEKSQPAYDDLVTLKGTVVDAQDQPVKGIPVFIKWKYPEPGRAETTTDAQGQFSLDVSKQRVRHQALQAADSSFELMAQHALPWVIKDDNSELKNIELQLQPSQRVELHVVDKAGQPIANAKTGIMDYYRVWGTGETDDKGRMVYRIPHDVEVRYVFAMRDGHGTDYKSYVLPRGQRGDKLTSPPKLPDHPVKLQLTGAHPLKVLVQDSDGKPLSGIEIAPWLLKKEDQSETMNLSYFYELIQKKTDAAGVVDFPWIPEWQTGQLIVWPRDNRYAHLRGLYDPQKGDGSLTMKLVKRVPISGQVLLPNGKPAAGITIQISGRGHQIDSVRGTVKTDETGRYEFMATPDMIYLVTAVDEKWASTSHTGFAVWPGKPIDNLDFQLRPATRIHGRVTIGSPAKPVEGQTIYVYEYGDDLSKLKEIKLPNPDHRTCSVQPMVVHSTTTDESGNYELFVGDGKFDIRGPRQISTQHQDRVQKFEIARESEKEFNFHALRPEKGMLTGTVVTGDPPQPVADAELTGIYRYTLAGRDMQSQTNASGTFEVERELHATVIYAQSPDKKRAGVVEIGPDDKTVTIPIQPLGSVTAQLIDSKTKEPLKEREIRYGVRINLRENSGPFRTSFGGKATTDDEGRVTLDHLVVGQKYDLNLVLPSDNPKNFPSWRTIDTVKLDHSKLHDLGVLEVDPPRAPYKPPTLAERITSAFTEKGTPVERFEKNQKDAKLIMQHMLVLFGDPKSEAVKQLMELRYQNGDVRKALYSFQCKAVDTSGDQRKSAQELAGKLGETLTGTQHDFFIIVTDQEGKPLARCDASALAKEGKINQEKVLDFLKANTVPILDAQELLASALKRAKAENKRVIVQETATWCGPCRLLSRYLIKEQHLWERDYIWIKMDHRWTDAFEIMKKMRDGAQGGIPWWAILDKDGKVLVTSNDESGANIGFPSDQSGRAHFRTMLEKTAIRLNPNEINTLVEALQEEK